jgi:predicted nucleic acid-binding protein
MSKALMISGLSRLPAKASTVVLDASVLINLLGSGAAADLLQALGRRFVVPEPTLAEVGFDPIRKRPAPDVTAGLIGAGLLAVVPLRGETADLFFELAANLGDGEAAVIAYAVRAGAFAAIDDRKARRIAVPLLPGRVPLFSIELLMAEDVTRRLGEAAVLDLVFQCLVNARMRVPHQFRDQLIELLGPERAQSCPSLGYRPS